MKKIFAKFICLMLIMSVAITSLIGCSASSWKGGNVTLKNSGAVKENGGFIAETENYLYFINGVQSTTANNKMGTPLKGALLVADKKDLSKTEVVVPKLFVASDYGAGVFIDNGYVYYATPSVEKNSEGQIANDEMAFMRTKLDGSGTTEEFFTLDTTSGMASQYRFVKGENGQVFLYYYNSDEPAIICYNTSTKASSTIIAQKEVEEGDSLDKHFFLNSKDMNEENAVVGYYTTTVYEEKHATLYNRVYVIKAGSDKGELLVDGNNDRDINDKKYSITLIKDGFMFFTTTNSGNTKTYAISEKDARVSTNWTDSAKITEIVNTGYVSSSTLIVSLDEIYAMGETKIYKTSFTTKNDKTPIALKEDISKLLFIREEVKAHEEGAEKETELVKYLYFYSAEGQIGKFMLDKDGEVNDDKQTILVSIDTASTAWYNVEVVEINGKDYLFYCDNSVIGKSYIRYVDLSIDEFKCKDTDGKDGNDLFYIDVEKILVFGKMADKDMAEVFDAKVTDQATFSPADGIGANEEDDKLFRAELDKLKAEYESFSSAVKEKVSIKTKNTLKVIEKAFELAEKYKMLADIEFVGSAEDAEELGVKAKYEQVKAYINNFKNNDEFRDGVDAYISVNLKAHWTKAVKLFEAKK